MDYDEWSDEGEYRALTSHSHSSVILYAFSEMPRGKKHFRAEESTQEKENESDEEVPNYYSRLPKKYKTEERTYPSESKIQIKIPFRMLVTGITGSGKTNAVMSVIKKINAFDKIMIYSKLLDEPLYKEFIDTVQEVEKKTGATILTTSNQLSDLPPPDSLNKENNNLLIIDDMIKEDPKLLGRVTQYFIYGRKHNCSSIFITQSYFKTPIDIRQNTGYFIFTKLGNDQDFKRILKEFSLGGVNEQQLYNLYKTATASGFPNFFMIDNESGSKDPTLRFRRNFKPLKPPEATVTQGIRPGFGPASGPGALPPGLAQKAQEKRDKTAAEVYGRQHKEKDTLDVAEPHVTSETKVSKKGKLKEYVDTRMVIDDSGEPMSLSDWRWELEDSREPMQTGDGVKKKRRKKRTVKKKASSKKVRNSGGKLLSDAQLLKLIQKTT